MSHKKMHDFEIDIDSPLVTQLINAQFPKWAALSIKPVSSDGTDNAIYRLGADMCVRLPRVPDAAKDVLKEQLWLPKLGLRLPLAIPELVATGKPSEHTLRL